MRIKHGEFIFDIDDSDLFKVHVNLVLIANPNEILWEDDSIRATPELERVWGLHEEGDYFQQTLFRHNRDLHPHTSYTALFHEMVRNNRIALDLIRNIYSTSSLDWLSMRYQFTDKALNFWQRQVAAGRAEYIPTEKRFKALL